MFENKMFISIFFFLDEEVMSEDETLDDGPKKKKKKDTKSKEEAKKKIKVWFVFTPHINFSKKKSQNNKILKLFIFCYSIKKKTIFPSLIKVTQTNILT